MVIRIGHGNLFVYNKDRAIVIQVKTNFSSNFTIVGPIFPMSLFSKGQIWGERYEIVYRVNKFKYTVMKR